MSAKVPAKKPVSPRIVPKQKKKRLIQNTFELVQFKKMIGKGLVCPFKGSLSSFEPELKNKILSKTVKTIAMTGFISSGIVYIYEGVDRLLALNAVSYAEIKKAELEIDVVLNQYHNLSITDLISA